MIVDFLVPMVCSIEVLKVHVIALVALTDSLVGRGHYAVLLYYILQVFVTFSLPSVPIVICTLKVVIKEEFSLNYFSS